MDARAGRIAWVLFALFAVVLAWAVVRFQPPAWLYPVAFVLVFLFYTNTLVERVPLYLSNRTTWAALAGMVGQEKPVSQRRRPAFIDLGCGLGGTVAHIARSRPDWDVWGVETAPGAYAIAKLRTLGIKNAHVRYRSLWRVDLGAFDVAYAFLSPAPMPRLLAKAEADMKGGGLLISNTFWPDDSPFDGVVEVADGRLTQLIFKRFSEV